MIYLVTPSMETFPTLHPTKRHDPTGGVTEPIPKFIINIIPKCTGLIPILVTMGRKIGVKISTAGVKSKNIPMTSRNTFMINNSTYLLLEAPIIILLMAAGIPLRILPKRLFHM